MRQLGHTGRKGSEVAKHGNVDGYPGGAQLPPDHPRGWQVSGPSAVPYGGGHHEWPVHALTVEEIHGLHRAYADAARRAMTRWRDRVEEVPEESEIPLPDLDDTAAGDTGDRVQNA